MKKQVFSFSLAILLLLGLALHAEAIWGPSINDPNSTYDGLVIGAYAIGDNGITQISTHHVYALTANGQVLLNSEGGDSGDVIDSSRGGGGLVFDNGSVRVFAERVRVALRYYYSEYRDSSMEEARLENAVGSGYAFGVLDENESFIPFDEDAWTDETQISMRPLEDTETGIGVYATETGELLYSVDASGKDAYLTVHPLGTGGDTLTWFSGRRYYGDFSYADLGNGKLTVVNTVPLETYVQGVCAGEMGGGFPLEALKAQAVAARSYMMYHITIGDYQASSGFDLSADDWSQVYLGYTDSEAIRTAVAATENQYMTYDGRIINAMFCAADGGETINSEDKFPSALPYLRGVKDPYEGDVWTRGAYGHRVGMSQWGAYAMAENYQKTYKDILGFYYTKVGISYGYS
ncbi:MAG: SpoIID/LytB domain-containing protein [Oscillospiraceae bacterium]|nr:SpoIID/LytB domain-containing protein [Oscillospiraceae bacterium]